MVFDLTLAKSIGKLMSNNSFLNNLQVENNINSLKKYMGDKKLDAIILTSNDIFLNEYAPLEDCHRYYCTQFTGSTGLVIVPRLAPVILFVDGRYFEQADLEVDAKLVEVFKCPQNVSIMSALKQTIKDRNYKEVGVEGDRIDLSSFFALTKITNVTSFNHGELNSVINFKTFAIEKKIDELDIELVGESTFEKCQRLLNSNEAYYITALDSIAWLTNLRRYEIPFQSTLRAKAFATSEKVYLLLEEVDDEFLNYFNQKSNNVIKIIKGKFSDLESFFKNLNEDYSRFIKIYFSENSINTSDFLKLKLKFGEEKLENLSEGIIPFHARKNPSELKSMERSFECGDQAIFHTILWIKNEMKKGSKLTELDLYNKTNEFYKKFGAKSQSFNTIAAVGTNSSIVHFSNPSESVKIESNSLLLLDSGGYFYGGYATDTTRAFLAIDRPLEIHKEIYTLVLKSLLHIQNVVFPEGILGSSLDGVARMPLFKSGHNFNHGTGHGVGINVHEGGYSISMKSVTPIKEFSVGSIEPGIYLPGIGGVRLENVVVVEKHPTFKNMLRFRPLVFIGFDHDLINEGDLTAEEKIWLENYERECQKRRRSFKYRE